jgi:quinol monooxygenase YgiN
MRMELPAKKRDEAIKILKLMAERCRVQPGCFSCNIYEDLQQKNIILFYNNWRSGEDLEQYLRSDYYRNTLLVLEMSENEPELRFDEVSRSTGIETVEKARQCPR